MSHAHTPPELPEVTDEAGESPKWLPRVGVIFFIAGAAWIWMCHGHCSSEGAEGDSAGEAAAP